MRHITVKESYQDGYCYPLLAREGQDFADDFSPELSPREMLQLGVFGGDYFTEVPHEFPSDWFDGVTLSQCGAQKQLNYFGVIASQPLAEWQRKGWIYPEDPKGWFLWYCRYHIGRRIADEDKRQINRWNAMRRHVAQVQAACRPGDESCRPRQRQALLQWAYDSREL